MKVSYTLHNFTSKDRMSSQHTIYASNTLKLHKMMSFQSDTKFAGNVLIFIEKWTDNGDG